MQPDQPSILCQTLALFEFFLRKAIMVMILIDLFVWFFQVVGLLPAAGCR